MLAQQADSLQRVLDRVFESRAYDWAPDADPWAWLRRVWSAFVLWLQDLQQASPLGFRILLYGTVVALLLILGHAVWVFMRTVRAGHSAEGGPVVPEEVSHDADWFRREAGRLAAAGRFRAAMEADFQALLLSLEARTVLTIQPSTTPAEYVRKVKLSPLARDDFERTVHRLYGYLFARWPCGPAEYAAWQTAVDPDRYAPAH